MSEDISPRYKREDLCSREAGYMSLGKLAQLRCDAALSIIHVSQAVLYLVSARR